MTTRSTELREKHRRVLAWSLGIAVVLHVAVFVFTPTFRTDSSSGWIPEVEPGQGEGIPLAIDVVFDAPEILERDGTASPDSPDRMLRTEYVLALSDQCAAFATERWLVATGRVRLRLNASGRADVVELAEGSGDECGDDALRAVADALWYRWLPSVRFPAPVELIQPVSLAEPSHEPDATDP